MPKRRLIQIVSQTRRIQTNEEAALRRVSEKTIVRIRPHTKTKKAPKERIETPTPTRRQSRFRQNRVSKDSRDTTNTESGNARRVSPRTATTQVVISEASDVSSPKKEEAEIEGKDEVTKAAESLMSLRRTNVRLTNFVTPYTYPNN
jgi:hypothetical protein